MQFLYQNAFLPVENPLLSEINNAAIRLYSKLQMIDIESLDISDYNKRYFGNNLKGLTQTLQKYSYILAWSVAELHKPINTCTILEYGGGSGILSLLARELNFKVVIYNDIYEISCRDAKTIASSIGNEADRYILGDIDDVITFFQKNDIRCNSVVSYDVIEHIYDMGYFIKKIPELTDKKCSTIVMSSGANSLNPLIVHNLKKRHVKAEFSDTDEYFGRKKRDALESYYSIRKRMIQRYAPDLSFFEIEVLATRTRGMIERDIVSVVDNYKITKKFPKKPDHPTNTCDPFTGNWAEHLMDVYQLKDQLEDAGFRSKIIPGYYGNPQKRGKFINHLIVPGVNTLINLPKCGIYLAPFFTLYGKMSDDDPD